MGRTMIAPSPNEANEDHPPPYSVDQQVRYPNMRNQGYYLPQDTSRPPANNPAYAQQKQYPAPRQQENKQQRRQKQHHKDQQPNQQKSRQQQQQQQQQLQTGAQRPKRYSRLRRAPPGVEVSPCIKYTIFFVNVIFWLLGVFMLGFGIWGVVSKALVSVEAIAEAAGVGFDPMYGFIIVGATIFILATSGCIGALRENTFLLKFFAYTLILIFLAEIIIGVLAYFYQDKVFGILDDWINSSIKNYYDDPDTQFIMDGMQTNLECCGAKIGPIDWEKNMYFACDSLAVTKCSVPYSCCIPETDNNVPNYQCGYGALKQGATPNIYSIGCVNGMKNWFITNAIALGIAGGVLIIMECLVICLTKSLINDIQCVKSYW